MSTNSDQTGGERQNALSTCQTKLILCVECDQSARVALLKLYDNYEEFEVQIAESGRGAISALEAKTFDAIFLADELNDGDGLEICHWIRRHGNRTPIIILSEQTGDAHLILCLERGANARITKPIKTGVLHAQLKSLLRQRYETLDKGSIVGSYVFYPTRKLFRHKETEQDVALTEMETAIVNLLLRAGGNWVRSDRFYKEVWGHSTAIATHSLQTQIYRLRQKIEPDPHHPKLIISEGSGYRLILDEGGQGFAGT